MLALALPSGAGAELLYFRGGGEVELPARTEGDLVVVDSHLGELTFDRSQFHAIHPIPAPERLWPERWARVRHADEKPQLEAIEWALDHGLVEQATSAIREATARPVAGSRLTPLLQAVEQLEADLPDPAENSAEDLTRFMGPRARVSRSAHVLLVHELSEGEAASRLAHLESVLIGFWLEATRLGMPVRNLKSRIPMLWFADRRDYRTFLAENSARGSLNTRGYYQPGRGLIAIYAAASDPARMRARTQLAAKSSELEAYRQQLSDLPPGARVRITRQGEPARMLDRKSAPAFLLQLERELLRDRLLLDIELRTLDFAVAAHELIHALVPASGLAPRQESFPTWLHEGLAMQFEAMRGGRWGGLAAANSLRLSDWATIPQPPPLEPVLTDAGLARGYNQGAYARAWAFVRFLRQERPELWRAWLEELRRQDRDPSIRRPRNWAIAAFLRLAAPATLESLETEWQDWTRSLRSPLDQNRPPAASIPPRLEPLPEAEPTNGPDPSVPTMP
jgi:hypothetical protein